MFVPEPRKNLVSFGVDITRVKPAGRRDYRGDDAVRHLDVDHDTVVESISNHHVATPWHFRQKYSFRASMMSNVMGVPQMRHGSPARRYTQ